MTRSDRVRRALTLTLVVFCLLTIPQLAFAKFDSSQDAVMGVGTASLVTPSSPTGSYLCTYSSNKKLEGADVSVTGFTASGQPAGVAYVYTLYRDLTTAATTTTPAQHATLSAPLRSRDQGSTVYRMTIVPVLGSWSAPERSVSFTCG